MSLPNTSPIKVWERMFSSKVSCWQETSHSKSPWEPSLLVNEVGHFLKSTVPGGLPGFPFLESSTTSRSSAYIIHPHYGECGLKTLLRFSLWASIALSFHHLHIPCFLIFSFLFTFPSFTNIYTPGIVAGTHPWKVQHILSFMGITISCPPALFRVT